MQNEDDQGDDEDDVDESTGNVECKSTASEEQQDDGSDEEHSLNRDFL